MISLNEKHKFVVKIISIMRDRLHFEVDYEMEDIENQPFFGRKLNLMSYELGYLLMEVERDFDIRIPESYLLDPGLKTINDFVRIICKK
jgi:acyl carrier protein